MIDKEELYQSISTESLCHSLKVLMRINSDSFSEKYPEDRRFCNQLTMHDAVTFMLEER
jgi:hypothetical protein